MGLVDDELLDDVLPEEVLPDELFEEVLPDELLFDEDVFPEEFEPVFVLGVVVAGGFGVLFVGLWVRVCADRGPAATRIDRANRLPEEAMASGRRSANGRFGQCSLRESRAFIILFSPHHRNSHRKPAYKLLSWERRLRGHDCSLSRRKSVALIPVQKRWNIQPRLDIR